MGALIPANSTGITRVGYSTEVQIVLFRYGFITEDKVKLSL